MSWLETVVRWGVRVDEKSYRRHGSGAESIDDHQGTTILQSSINHLIETLPLPSSSPISVKRREANTRQSRPYEEGGRGAYPTAIDPNIDLRQETVGNP